MIVESQLCKNWSNDGEYASIKFFFHLHCYYLSMHADVCISAFRVSCFRAQRNEILNCRSFIYTFLSHIFYSIAGIFNENALDYLITQLINPFCKCFYTEFSHNKVLRCQPALTIFQRSSQTLLCSSQGIYCITIKFQ